MKEQVGRFGFERVIVVVLRGDDKLDRLFPELLRDAVKSFTEKLTCVRFGLWVVASPGDHVRQLKKDLSRCRVLAKARRRSRMTCRPIRDDANQQSVIITVWNKFLYAQKVSAGFAFHPDLASRSRVKGGAT